MKFVERTLVLIKPDAVLRGIAGKIMERFESTGLKIIGLKIVRADRVRLNSHFPVEDASWVVGMGEKSLENYRTFSIDPIEELGTDDPLEIGKIILEWNFQYLLSGPVIAIVLQGPRAVSTVRKIIGNTIPAKAMPGTIRGDFSVNSADFSNSVKSSCKNVVHASGNVEEAEKEIRTWFDEEDLVEYLRSDEKAMFF